MAQAEPFSSTARTELAFSSTTARTEPTFPATTAQTEPAFSSRVVHFPSLSDKEIIAHLLHKVSKIPVPLPPSPNNIELPTFDICGSQKPWQIYDNDACPEIYFFSKLSMNDHVSKIMAGYGTWKEYSTKVHICDNRSQVIGYMKRFKFKSFDGSTVDDKGTRYFLKVFVLDNKFKACVKPEYKDYLCCLVIKKYYALPDQRCFFDVDMFLDQMSDTNALPAAATSPVMQEDGDGDDVSNRS